jgi:transport and Golgi organization protein 2
VCTVVIRWAPGDPVCILALRDELASREFDLPDRWWPDQPGVVGGRDRQAGGSWCVTDVAAGATALVLNRPERRAARPGAASRGLLPLLAVRAGSTWRDEISFAPMASFNLVLVTPHLLQWWAFDGTALVEERLGAGTWMLTPRGRRTDPLDPRLLDQPARTAWIDVVGTSVPSPDPTDGLVVQHPIGDDSYETVFGQVLETRPQWMRLDYLRAVARNPGGAWSTQSWASTTDTVMRVQ